MSALWVTLAGYKDPASWVIGVPAVIAATWSHSRLSARGNGRVSLMSLVRLLPVFLWESLRGGLDVARRVLRFRPNVNPGLFDYRLSLSSPPARVFFVDLVSLLPGTLSADVSGDRLRVHALDVSGDSVAELRRLERQVAAIFCQNLRDERVEKR